MGIQRNMNKRQDDIRMEMRINIHVNTNTNTDKLHKRCVISGRAMRIQGPPSAKFDDQPPALCAELKTQLGSKGR